jgi:hypothetical protein
MAKCPSGCACGRHTSSAVFQAGLRADGTPAWGSYVDHYGYRILTGQQGHPLACRNGELKEHRRVLYEKIGPGTHNCWICGKELGWDQIIPDHLDENRLNNDPDNLAPACRKCNWDRNNPSVVKGAKTRCVNGHNYTPENTRINSKGYRECWSCLRSRYAEKNRRYRSKKIIT